ncbi:pyridoxamine 5'-phosphate oxidase family protein [Paeniclostridium sp. NSJ-45]|uniref:Pyridoxamine 5'-phosphate oxidase family protein n=1 Tax=Paeniclostridium hominis TaxID=2764329 RepID=A0ABR7K2G7_9FIRM|nr:MULTISPECIES: pyridoxamine 5'-phosphate oxidase family protein [Paeniclostridium]MBC6003216.1 pyridoxamine 5'-phosphate oxidase family protein [Paeniclostridium hominis]
MFRQMRRQNRKIEIKEEIDQILNKGEYGTLATIGENGYPHSVPISYVYYEKCIYFHSAKVGHKIDNIKNHEKVSFNVVGDTEVLPSKFSTKYESVIAFGIATEIDGEEKEMALLKLIEKYSPEFLQEGKLYISRAKDATSVMKISIEHMTGKAIK